MTALIEIIGGWRATAFLLLAIAGYTVAGLQTLRLDHERTQLITLQRDAAESRAQAEHDARLAEARLATAASNADAQYTKGMTDAQNASDALAAALRAGTVQLQPRWQCPTATDRVSAPADDQRRADVAADERAASASRIVAAADTCDAQVIALQTYIRDAQRAIAGAGAP